MYIGKAQGWVGTQKIFWRGCAAPVFDRMPLAKENLVENIPLAKENFLIMSPFWHDFKELGTCETGTCGSTTPNASRTRRWRSACHPTYLPSCDSSKRSSWTSGRAFPPSRSLAAPWGIWHNGHMSNCLWLGELTGSGLPSPRKLSWSKCWTQNHSSR